MNPHPLLRQTSPHDPHFLIIFIENPPVVQPKSCGAIADQSPAFLFFEIGMRTKETVNETIILMKSKRNIVR